MEKAYDDARYYFWFAKEFGWTKETVDEQQVGYLDGLAAVAAVQAEIDADKRAREARKNAGRR